MSIKLDTFINNINQATVFAYKSYWESIKPKSEKEFFLRWLFAILSVHTTWQNNLYAFNLLKDLKWTEDESDLNQKIIISKVGLNKNRSRAIWEIFNKFRINPNFYYKENNESWVNYRNRVSADTFMLGYAKTSFAISMCYPTENETICFDTHILQLVNWDKDRSPTNKEYIKLEQDWISKCKLNNIPPSLSREIYWDGIQKQDNSKYWTKCFEN